MKDQQSKTEDNIIQLIIMAEEIINNSEQKFEITDNDFPAYRARVVEVAKMIQLENIQSDNK